MNAALLGRFLIPKLGGKMTKWGRRGSHVFLSWGWGLPIFSILYYISFTEMLNFLCQDRILILKLYSLKRQKESCLHSINIIHHFYKIIREQKLGVVMLRILFQ